MRVACFTNHYPKGRHSFNRREICALEQQGVKFASVALLGWPDPLVDSDDVAERRLTHYLLKRFLAGRLGATLHRFLAEPGRLLNAFAASMRMSQPSDHLLKHHWVYLIISFARSQLFRWISFSDWPKIHVMHRSLDPALSALPSNPSLTSTSQQICLGQLCERKGPRLLVKSVHRLRDRGEPVELVLTGEGELRQDIEDLIRMQRLGEQITITEWVSSEAMKAHSLAARALALGRHAEGLPVVIVESMALGRPVVSTRIAGIPELVRAGQDGWPVSSGDVEALTEAMSDALRVRIWRLKAMGAKVRERVLACHDFTQASSKLARRFREAMQCLNTPEADPLSTVVHA